MIRDRLHAHNILAENTRGVALIFIDDHSAQVHVAVLHADLDRGAMGPALLAQFGENAILDLRVRNGRLSS